jgi:hypothetical protein
MKKINVLSLLLITLSAIGFAQSKNGQDSLRQIRTRDSLKNRLREDSSIRAFKNRERQDSTKMSFTVKSNSEKVKSGKILLNLEFKNVSNETIKILEPFDEDMKVHFYLTIYCKTGDISPKYNNSLMLYNGGFVDYSVFSKYKYIEINRGKTFKHTINLTDIIKQEYDNLILPKGVYRVAMSYTNGKGGDCIVGTFKSPDIKFTVTE